MFKLHFMFKVLTTVVLIGRSLSIFSTGPVYQGALEECLYIQSVFKKFEMPEAFAGDCSSVNIAEASQEQPVHTVEIQKTYPISLNEYELLLKYCPDDFQCQLEVLHHFNKRPVETSILGGGSLYNPLMPKPKIEYREGAPQFRIYLNQNKSFGL